MGGKALKNCQTRRVDRVEYEEISCFVIAIISRYFAMVGVPKFVDTKKDFGDVDIIVSSQLDGKLEKKMLRKQIATDLNSLEWVNNGPVDSFEFRNFQIDLIEMPSESFSAALQFMSWGDLGMLIGVTANSLGLSYGEMGLFLPVYAEADLLEDFGTLQQALNTPVPKPIFYKEIHRKSDGKLLRLGLIGKVLLTDDMNKVYSFLGFHCNTDVSNLHFNCEEEIFQFVLNCDYFDPEAYGVLTGDQVDSESSANVLQSAEDGRYDGYNIDPAKLNKKYRDRLFKRPIFSHFLKKISLDESCSRSRDYPNVADMNIDETYDIAIPEDPKRWEKRIFHRTRALDTFLKWDAYEHLIRVERLKRVARHLAPTNEWVMEMTDLRQKKLGDWLQKFKATKSASYQDVNNDLKKFVELSAYEKWVLEQNSRESIQQTMRELQDETNTL